MLRGFFFKKKYFCSMTVKSDHSKVSKIMCTMTTALSILIYKLMHVTSSFEYAKQKSFLLLVFVTMANCDRSFTSIQRKHSPDSSGRSFLFLFLL